MALEKKLSVVFRQKSLDLLREMTPYDQTDGYKNRDYEESHDALSETWWKRWQKKWGDHVMPTDVIARDVVSQQARQCLKIYDRVKNLKMLSGCEDLQESMNGMSTNTQGKIYIDDFMTDIAKKSGSTADFVKYCQNQLITYFKNQ